MLTAKDYSKDEIEEDKQLVDWDMAFKEVEDGEHAKQ